MHQSQRTAGQSAIVIAAFGTTVASGVPSIFSVLDRVRVAFPGTEVRLTFTSNIVRGVWRRRRNEAERWLAAGVPKEIFHLKNIISTIGDLREDGYTSIIVQPLHMFFMEQSHDLAQHVAALAGIRTMKEKWRPFERLVMARPALGMPGVRYPYLEDIAAAARALAGDVDLARRAGAMLVYMGHGNHYWSTGVYGETERALQALYPDVPAFVGVVEGTPDLDSLLPRMEATGCRRVLLKPFMLVAGEHAVKDMAGPEADSWRSLLTSAGFEVEAIQTGLGSNPAFAELFVSHIRDTAQEQGIALAQ